MGPCVSTIVNADYKISVVTGDLLGAGMDSNVYITLFDSQDHFVPDLVLDNRFRNDFERGKTDHFNIKLSVNSDPLHDLDRIKLRRDDKGFASDWFVQYIRIKNIKSGTISDFPLQRWIKPFCDYNIVLYDTSLPQDDKYVEQRTRLLKEKRNKYILDYKHKSLPAQIENIPDDETFSWDYKWDIIKRKAKLIARSKIVSLFSSNWENLSQIRNVYTKNTLPEPSGARTWKEDSSFARQRTQGCSIGLIKLCAEIPDKLGVTDEMMSPFLEGLTIDQAIENKRLFMVDLQILQGLTKKEGYHICTPIALFFEKNNKELLPIAIQLEQQKGPNNPVFLPTDSKYTWLMAKVWYNNADATYHQSCTHLGFTHLLMEGICVSFNKNISQSHPIYKLLAPHFLFLIAINSRGLKKLISPGGWVDKTMSCGVEGMFELIHKGLSQWRLDVEGTLPTFFSRRGVMDCLSDYPFRDDALLIYNIILRYVTEIVNLYYDTPDKIKEDWEIQAWAKEMVTEQSDGGLGIKGVPGNGIFTTSDQLITALTSIISTCSIQHAAANFLQYDEYGFPPNYPAILTGRPPTTKAELTEKDILNVLPDKETTLDSMVVTKILSNRGTQPLGDFEVQYTFDPAAKQIVSKFKEELEAAAKVIDERNTKRLVPYTILHPSVIPNSISI